MDPLVFLVILAIATKYAAADTAYAVRGKPNPRYEARKARYAAQAVKAQAKVPGKHPRRPGPARRYLAALWADAFTDAHASHMRRRDARRSRPERPDRPRGAARVYVDGLVQDTTRWVGRKWDKAWTEADEKRRANRVRPGPETVIVPGTVVPNAEPRPATADPEGPDPEFPAGPVAEPAPTMGTTTAPTEGPTMNTTSMSTAEVFSLQSAIDWAAGTAAAAEGTVSSIEQTTATLSNAEVGPATTGHLARAQELFASAAAAMRAAETELRKDTTVSEAYAARPAAGTKEFVTAG